MKQKRQADPGAWGHLSRKQRRRYWMIRQKREGEFIDKVLQSKARTNCLYDFIMANAPQQ